MNRAIALAEYGRYKTAPNPCVGAVLVYKNIILAEGYHSAYGKAHAEVACLCDALAKGIFFSQIQKNALFFSNPVLQEQLLKYKDTQYAEEVNIAECSLYVTLEPCNHFGKTPPCSQAIYEAGIKTVYVGYLDPNPVASGGIVFLKERGLQVYTGICEKECKALLDDFFVWQKEKRPFCIVKMACTLDGKIGPAKGHSHVISGAESKQVTMQFRRHMAEAKGAVMVGANTFFLDNPKLTVRNMETRDMETGEIKTEDMETPLQPMSFILSKKLPPITQNKTGYYCLDEKKQTVIFTSAKDKEILEEYEKFGIQLEFVDTNNDGTLNLKEIFEKAFRVYHCPYIFCEGGAALAQSLLKAGLVDELILYLAPFILGDETAKNVFRGNIVESMQEAYHLKLMKTEKVGEDLHLYLKMEKPCLQD